MSASRVTRPIFYGEKCNTVRYMPFLAEATEEEKVHDFFQQDSETPRWLM